MGEIKLFDTDFVLWDIANDSLVRFDKNGDIVIFGDKEDAERDCYGNEVVVSCTDLPQYHQDAIIKQLEKA